jgi:hypothetical protein
LSTEKAQLISVLAAIWYSRNKLVHGTVGYDPGKCVEGIKQDLLEIVIPKVVVRKGAPKPVCKWTAPVGEVVKLNSDGAICETEGRG